MNTSVMMTAAMEKAMVSSTTEFARVMVRALSEKYGFDEAEAVSFLELSATKVSRAEPKSKRVPKEKKEKMLVPSMSLPFCGVVMDGWCKGIRSNHELFTQCTMVPKGGSYCATCAGQARALAKRSRTIRRSRRTGTSATGLLLVRGGAHRRASSR